MIQRLFLPLLLITALAAPAPAQILDVTVKVNTEAISVNYRENVRDFQQDVENYLRNYEYGDPSNKEHVPVTLEIFLLTGTEDGKYTAQVFVGASRPVFGGSQSSATVRILDELWEFTYVRGRAMDHTTFSFNDLTSFLDFYMLFVLGFDYDTYDRLGGTPYFSKAADVATLGISSGLKSWTPTLGGYSRPRFVREMLSPQYEPLRQASWKYHFTGLDSLAFNRPLAQKNILDALESIGASRRSLDPQNIAIKSFFDTKYLEIAALFLDYPDRNVYGRLIRIDPNHQKTYEEYAAKRK
jgi:hypothetical protein